MAQLGKYLLCKMITQNLYKNELGLVVYVHNSSTGMWGAAIVRFLGSLTRQPSLLSWLQIVSKYQVDSSWRITPEIVLQPPHTCMLMCAIAHTQVCSHANRCTHIFPLYSKYITLYMFTGDQFRCLPTEIHVH